MAQGGWGLSAEYWSDLRHGALKCSERCWALKLTSLSLREKEKTPFSSQIIPVGPDLDLTVEFWICDSHVPEYPDEYFPNVGLRLV